MADMDLTKLNSEQLVQLLGKQSRKLLKTSMKLELAYRALAHHGCKGTVCGVCGGVK